MMLKPTNLRNPGVCQTCGRMPATRALSPSARTTLSCSRANMRLARTSRPLVGDADLVIVHEWNEPALVASDRQAARRWAVDSRCCSTTRIIARFRAPRRCARTTLTAMMGCWRSAQRSPRVYERLGLGRDACSSGTRPPTSGVSIRRRSKERARALSGSATGATTNAARSWSISCCGRHERRACRSTSTAFAIPTGRSACWRSMALATTAGSPMPRLPMRSPAISRRCTCRAAFTGKCFRASRPSACSRRSPAESRWFRRRGTIASICSGLARTS